VERLDPIVVDRDPQDLSGSSWRKPVTVSVRSVLESPIEFRVEPWAPMLEDPLMSLAAWIRRGADASRVTWARRADTRTDRLVLLLGEVGQLIEAQQVDLETIVDLEVVLVLAMPIDGLGPRRERPTIPLRLNRSEAWKDFPVELSAFGFEVARLLERPSQSDAQEARKVRPLQRQGSEGSRLPPTSRAPVEHLVTV
jgi:hypothetical protein